MVVDANFKIPEYDGLNDKYLKSYFNHFYIKLHLKKMRLVIFFLIKFTDITITILIFLFFIFIYIYCSKIRKKITKSIKHSKILTTINNIYQMKVYKNLKYINNLKM